jgi:hypothetical protein
MSAHPRQAKWQNDFYWRLGAEKLDKRSPERNKGCG